MWIKVAMNSVKIFWHIELYILFDLLILYVLRIEPTLLHLLGSLIDHCWERNRDVLLTHMIQVLEELHFKWLH